MDQSSSVNRWHLAILAALIIGMVLCLSWTPAYGFGFSKADLAAGSGSAPVGNPPSGTPVGNGSTPIAPTTSWTTTFADSPETCPPPIPEPGTLILLGLGLAGGAAIKRLRG
jgi:hypothetical protein